MLKTHWKLISHLERVCDNVVLIASFLLAYHLRDPIVEFIKRYGTSLPANVSYELGTLDSYLVILITALPLYNLILSFSGAYRSMRLSSFSSLARVAILSSVVLFLCEGAVLFLLKLDLSRSFVALFCTLAAVLFFCERYAVLTCLRYFRMRGKNYRNLLIVGTGEQARMVYSELAFHPELGVRIAGFVDMHSALQGERRQVVGGLEVVGSSGEASAVYDLGGRVIATADTYEATLKRFAVDEVLFTDVAENFSQVKSMAKIAAEEGITVTLAADLFSMNLFQSGISYFGSVPLLHYQHAPGDSGTLVVKRLVDVGVSSTLLVALSPVFLLIALLIKTDSSGPVFFRQRRVGLNGRKFTLYKFRSMILDAEKQLEKLRHRNEMSGPVFKLKDDPRVTPLGSFLRRYSIDEFPQLFNVFRGDMSLVGPRPPLPEEVSKYYRKQRRRLSMRPGITCTWQVSGRNEIPDFEEWAKLDLEYIDNWSLRSDFKLLLKTIPAVFSGSGS